MLLDVFSLMIEELVILNTLTHRDGVISFNVDISSGLTESQVPLPSESATDDSEN